MINFAIRDYYSRVPQNQISPEKRQRRNKRDDDRPCRPADMVIQKLRQACLRVQRR